MDKGAPSWIGPATHRRKGGTAPEKLARVARCRKRETGRNAETRSASDRNHSSPRQDWNIATDHNGMAPARRSRCHASRIRELNRVFDRLTSGTRVWVREAGCKDCWLEKIGAHNNLAVSVIAVATRTYTSTSRRLSSRSSPTRASCQRIIG